MSANQTVSTAEGMAAHVTDGPTQAERVLAWLIGQVKSGSGVLVFDYTNHRGESARRMVSTSFLRLYWGSTEYHKEPQWLMETYDWDKREYRSFAVKDIAILGA